MSVRESNSPTEAGSPVHAVLIPGFWLGAWAWWDVEATLRGAGIETHAVTLPGLDGRGSDGVTLDGQIDAVVQLAASLTGDVMLVGHSGGGSVVQGVTDRVPELIRRVIYVDSGPLIDGARIRVTNPERLEVPASVICTSFPHDVLLTMIENGAIPSELASVRDVRFVDLPTGHWPMFSGPDDLADVLRDEIHRAET